MLETMKRNKILTYAFLMAIPMTTGNIFSSCTDDFEKLNTSNIQVVRQTFLLPHNVPNR